MATYTRDGVSTQSFPREVVCPVCYTRTTVYDKAEEKRVRAENGCGDRRCVG